jgi:hypothetical protein
MQQPRAKNLRRHADEARALADRMQDSRTRLSMWKLACSYDLLARHAEAHEFPDPGEKPANERKAGDRAA